MSKLAINLSQDSCKKGPLITMDSRREVTETQVKSPLGSSAKEKHHLWLKYPGNYQGDNKKDALSEEKEVEARKKRIKDLLVGLPSHPPTLQDLDKEKWWKLIIDKKDHNSANKARRYSFNMNKPGKFYDRDKSPGYYQGMIKFFERELVGKQKSVQEEMNYDKYTEFHILLTQYVSNDKRESMREPNGCDRGDYTYAIYDYPEISKADGPEQQERIAAYNEIINIKINGLPLLKYYKLEDLQAPFPKGIGALTHSKEGESIVRPLYTQEEGKELVSICLKSYEDRKKELNDRKKEAPQTEEERIQIMYDTVTEIAEEFRDLHMIHQKDDACGRLHQANMYKRLKEAGLPLTILPNGPVVFGGRKTLDGLVEDIVVGMYDFIKQVKKHPNKGSSGQPGQS